MVTLANWRYTLLRRMKLFLNEPHIINEQCLRMILRIFLIFCKSESRYSYKKKILKKYVIGEEHWVFEGLNCFEIIRFFENGWS